MQSGQRNSPLPLSSHSHIFTDFAKIFQHPSIRTRGALEARIPDAAILPSYTYGHIPPSGCPIPDIVFLQEASPGIRLPSATPLIAAHCRFIIRRIRAALPHQFFHNQACSHTFPISVPVPVINPLAHLYPISLPESAESSVSYDGSHNTEHDIARNCQNKAI